MAVRPRERLIRFSRVVDIAGWIGLGLASVALVGLAFQDSVLLGIASLVLPIAYAVWVIRYVRRPVGPDDPSLPRRPWWW